MTLSNRRVVGHHRVFDVLLHDVNDSNGRALRDVYTFGCSDWCNVIAITPEREVVCIWQYRFGTERLELEIPGGVIEPGESPLATATRELREETGYEAEHVEELGSTSPNPALQGNTCHFFLATGARKTAATKFDEHEDIEVVLVPESEIAKLIDDGMLRHSLAIVALERYLRHRPR